MDGLTSGGFLFFKTMSQLSVQIVFVASLHQASLDVCPFSRFCWRPWSCRNWHRLPRSSAEQLLATSLLQSTRRSAGRTQRCSNNVVRKLCWEGERSPCAAGILRLWFEAHINAANRETEGTRQGRSAIPKGRHARRGSVKGWRQ